MFLLLHQGRWVVRTGSNLMLYTPLKRSLYISSKNVTFQKFGLHKTSLFLFAVVCCWPMEIVTLFEDINLEIVIFLKGVQLEQIIDGSRWAQIILLTHFSCSGRQSLFKSIDWFPLKRQKPYCSNGKWEINLTGRQPYRTT